VKELIFGLSIQVVPREPAAHWLDLEFHGKPARKYREMTP